MKMYVPANDQTYEPTEDPLFWRAIVDCDEDCHHPVHAWHPERRKHLERTVIVLSQGRSVP